MIEAREASEADSEVLVTLAEMARDEARPERGGELLLVHDNEDLAAVARLEQAAGTGHLSVVGLIDDVVVGYALAQQHERGGIRSVMIDELFVHVEARGVGVGAAMLSEVQGWARAHGCDVIESQVLPGNRAAKNFFERVGMVTRKMQVSARLG